MDQKSANNKLMSMLGKYSFTPEEIEAIKTAIGILSLSSLFQGKLKAIKDKRSGDTSYA